MWENYRDVIRGLTVELHGGEPDEGGCWATCAEMPGANGQGETLEKCLESLATANQLLIECD